MVTLSRSWVAYIWQPSLKTGAAVLFSSKGNGKIAQQVFPVAPLLSIVFVVNVFSVYFWLISGSSREAYILSSSEWILFSSNGGERFFERNTLLSS